MKIVTVDQMRELERRAVQAGVTEDSLMETAGLAVARYVAQDMGGVRGKRAVVLVGPGNNGGDGMVAARYLADWGALVTLYMTSPRRREDKFEECQARRVRIVEAAEDTDLLELDGYVPLTDVVLDAVFGIGNDRPLGEPLSGTFEHLRALGKEQPRLRFIAIDVPTGVNADTGACDPACFHASVTLTLGAPKVGLYRFPGAAHVGRIEVLPIGLPAGIDEDILLTLADSDAVAPLLPDRPLDGHKGSFGEVLVLAGSRRFVGAPVLATTAAYRSGAGLVTLAAPVSAYRLAAPQVLEQVHLPLQETDDGYIAPAAASVVRDALDQASAGVIGPGLGNVESIHLLMAQLLLTDPGTATPCVIDADALNALAATYAWWKRLSCPAVLTPHPGEISRLLATSVAEVEEDRVATAVEAAGRWQQVVVLKGAYTVVAAPDGRCAINPFANPALATAGTGDVLSGVIGALLAQGLAPYEAAVAGTHIHAATAQRVVGALGPSGMLASDLLGEIPKTLQACLTRS